MVIERPGLALDENVIAGEPRIRLRPDDLFVENAIELHEGLSQNVARAAGEEDAIRQGPRMTWSRLRKFGVLIRYMRREAQEQCVEAVRADGRYGAGPAVKHSTVPRQREPSPAASVLPGSAVATERQKLRAA